MLDRRSLAGDLTWGRLATVAGPSTGKTASKATPVTLALRDDLAWLLLAHRRCQPVDTDGEIPSDGLSDMAAAVLELLQQRGARFHYQLADDAALSASDVEAALWELVWRGEIHADSFHALRSLFDSRDRGQTRRSRGLRRGTALRARGEGRWTLLGERVLKAEADELAEAVAEQLIVRWGVVFHALVATEALAVPWREILWALRRLEARGTIRGGRFVAGFGGEQYASHEAADTLTRVRGSARSGVCVELSGCDPLNLTGVITPGVRVPARRTERVRYLDGIPDGSTAS